MQCETCKFWTDLGTTDVPKDGWCRRHAPVAQHHKKKADDRRTAGWPLTRPVDWCGEYTKREN